MTRKQMHIKALSKGIDSQMIKGSMTVILLGHAVDIMMELQDAHEAKLKAKDTTIDKLNRKYQSMQNTNTDNLIKALDAQAEVKAKDERIAELEAMVEKITVFARCPNCGESMDTTNIGIGCSNENCTFEFIL